MNSKTYLTVEDLEEKELVPGIFARFVHMKQMTIGHVRILQGSILPEHHHPHEQVTNVISGELEMTIGGQTHLCQAGQAIVIPGDVPHSARAMTDCYVIDAFSPVREDYR